MRFPRATAWPISAGIFGATIKSLTLAWKRIRWQERVTELQPFTEGASFV